MNVKLDFVLREIAGETLLVPAGKTALDLFNEEYCKWCYTDGEFKYESKEPLIDFCVEHMANESWPAEQVRADVEEFLARLRELGIVE